MKKTGKELDFISQINRSGIGTVPISNNSVEYLNDEEFELRCLSLTEETYIAIGFNSFVVRLKKIPDNMFRKKPIAIEAIQYTGRNGLELEKWSGGKVIQSPVLEPTDDNPTGEYVQIKTIDSVAIALVNDWICKGIKGEFYPCKNDIFQEIYEPI